MQLSGSQTSGLTKGGVLLEGGGGEISVCPEVLFGVSKNPLGYKYYLVGFVHTLAFSCNYCFQIQVRVL